jgi:DNA-directed RNA polymerase specialized sigma24 family protein
MPTASEPRSEELFEVMRGSDPEAATRAFQRFLVTPSKWWNGDNPLIWARDVAAKHVAHLDRLKWPVHKLGDPDWVANDALILLARLAPRIDCPPAFVRRVIYNTIQWEIAGRGRKGEPWGHDPEEVLEWKSAPSPDSASRRLWQNKTFCRRVARAINSLTDTLRPYAILNLLDGQRPVDIARTLNVDEAKARQYLRRALQALVGRKDAKQLLKMANSRVIRNALAEPEVAEVDSQAVLDELIQQRRVELTAAPVHDSSDVDPAHDFTTSALNDVEFAQDGAEAPSPATLEVPLDESEAG